MKTSERFMRNVQQRSLVISLSILLSGCAAFGGFAGSHQSNVNSSDRLVSGESVPNVSIDAGLIERFKDNTYVFKEKKPTVWSALLDILSSEYLITVLEFDSGIITTDWDKIYKSGQLFRNRLTIRVKQSRAEETLLILNNKSEFLSSKVWLPHEDDNSEVKRIIGNLSKTLGKVPPVSK